MPIKPSTKEEQFIREQELKQQLAKARTEQEAMAAAEKKRQKELHYLHCPKCGQKLEVQVYGTVEVDFCAGCRGLWLDANELEQIVASQEHTGRLRKFLKILGA